MGLKKLYLIVGLFVALFSCSLILADGAAAVSSGSTSTTAAATSAQNTTASSSNANAGTFSSGESAPSSNDNNQSDAAKTKTNEEGYQSRTPIIGLDFFDPGKGASTFNLSRDNAVQPDYLLKPGDEVVIDIWGDLDFHYSLPVNGDGFIVIPQVGRVDLNGLTFDEAKEKIINKLADTYNFYIDVKNPGAGRAHVDISMGKIAGVQAYVTGEVMHPGSVYLNGTNSSVIAAIRAAGGVSNEGSIRGINIIHPNGKETTFDLYDFLFYGKLTPEVKYLQDGDMINIPFRKSQVAVMGAVVRPGFYEVFENTTLFDLIKLAGGLQKYASNKIKVYREKKGQFLPGGVGEKDIFYVDYSDPKQNIKLESGDVISVELYPEAKIYDVVKVQGNAIKIPGDYKYTKGTKISDYINMAGGLYQDVEDKVDLLRFGKDLQTTIIPLSLKGILANDPQQNIEVTPGDTITFYTTKDLYGTQFVSLEGHVKHPGRYYYHNGLTAYELLTKQGGLLDKEYLSNVYLKQANIYRMNLDLQRQEVVSFPLGKLLNGDMKENIELQPGDKVVVYDLLAMQEVKSVTIEGEVNKPGTYSIDENANLNSLIIEAGGFKPDALLEKIEIGMKGSDYSKINTTVDYNSGAGKNYALKNNDFIIVQKDPYYEIRNATITVSGEVKLPGTYNFVRGDKILDMINKAGGLRPDAFIPGAEFYRNDQRIQMNLQKALDNPKSDFNFILAPGDRLYIPEKKYFIIVKGAVVNPKTFICISGNTAAYYINLSGGFTLNANKDATRIILPDGTIQQAFTYWWFQPDPDVVPGSTIEVPSK